MQCKGGEHVRLKGLATISHRVAAFALARERAREGLATLPKAGGASHKTNQELGHLLQHNNLIKQNLDEKVSRYTVSGGFLGQLRLGRQYGGIAMCVGRGFLDSQCSGGNKI